MPADPDVDPTVVRVLVVDDQHLIREGIASLLAIEPGIVVVGTAANGRESLAQAAVTSPDVVLMDVRMPVLDGVEATALLRQRFSSCRVIMLTTFDDEKYVLRALRAGASGYLLKDLPGRDLARAVRLVHAGVDQLDPSVTGRLMAALARVDASAVSNGQRRTGALGPGRPVVALTGRERDVLRLIASGATNREIAARLFVSEGTVKNHVSSILTRLGLRDRTQAALYAHNHDLL